MFENRVERQARNGKSRRHAAQGRAGQLQPQTEDQKRAKGCIHNAAQNRRCHRAPRIAMGTQDRTADHADQQHRQGGHDDLQIVHRKFQRLTRRPQ